MATALVWGGAEARHPGLDGRVAPAAMPRLGLYDLVPLASLPEWLVPLFRRPARRGGESDPSRTRRRPARAVEVPPGLRHRSARRRLRRRGPGRDATRLRRRGRLARRPRLGLSRARGGLVEAAPQVSPPRSLSSDTRSPIDG